MLSDNLDNGFLSLTDEVKQQFNMKHPEASPKLDMLLLHGPLNERHEIVFYETTEDLIHKRAIRIKGAAGPSKFDADDSGQEFLVQICLDNIV